MVEDPKTFPIEIARVTHEQSVDATRASLTFRGALVQVDQRASFVEECTAEAPSRFTLKFDFTADTDLNLQMWRHYFFLPVKDYAGAGVLSDTGKLTLPAEPTKHELLEGVRSITVGRRDLAVAITSTTPMALWDHRQFGTQDYLLAAYPVGGEVKRGTKWSIEMTVAVEARR